MAFPEDALAKALRVLLYPLRAFLKFTFLNRKVLEFNVSYNL